jgi:hypothetical protein
MMRREELETRGDYMQRLERNINRIETITRKELDKERE